MGETDIEFYTSVVPLEGTWIEICLDATAGTVQGVVPLEGTWIEIKYGIAKRISHLVVPLEGTWIEIRLRDKSETSLIRRTP